MVVVNFKVVLASGVSQKDVPELLNALGSAFEGRAAALFVTLAGCGVVLLNKRSVVWKRGLFFVVFGYLWQIVWPGDILHYYGFYFLVAWLVWNAPIKRLLTLASASMLAFVLAFSVLDYGAGWNWLKLDYVDFWTPIGQARNLFFNGWHPMFPWLSFLFLGMALAHGGIAEPVKRRRALWISASVLVGVTFLSKLLSGIPDGRPWTAQIVEWWASPEAMFGVSSLPPMPLYVLSAASSSTLLLALCIELTDRETPQLWARLLAHTGQLSFTFYVAHVLLGLGKGVRLLPDSTWLEEAWMRAAVFALGALIFANFWRKFFKRGPLEWVMRRLTS